MTEPLELVARALRELSVAAAVCEIDENKIVVGQALRIRAASRKISDAVAKLTTPKEGE